MDWCGFPWASKRRKTSSKIWSRRWKKRSRARYQGLKAVSVDGTAEAMP
jgi:hypothetical protein